MITTKNAHPLTLILCSTPLLLHSVADPIKETTPAAIEALHKEGLTIVMLTGDNQKTAEAVAKKLGIDDVKADVLPAQKAEAVKALQAKGHIVAMAGDGINDAPALAQAEVGIAKWALQWGQAPMLRWKAPE